MLQVDDEKETIHVYVVREAAARPSFAPLVLSLLTLFTLVTGGILTPYRQPVVREAIRVPAVLLPLRTLSITAPIIPTGRRTYPATCAQGRLTITNGTIIAQTIPAGFTLAGVTTDTAVFVPAGSVNGYGRTTVSAHALTCGISGNIRAYTLSSTLGAGVYIRNLTAFSGGKDAHTIPVPLPQDRQAAWQKARAELLQRSQGLHYPCSEAVNNEVSAVQLVITCQFVTYHLPPFYHVTGVRLVGKFVLVAVWFVARKMQPTYGK